MGTVTNPLGSLIQGLLTGHNLGQQILQEKRQQEAYERQVALQEEEDQIRDIQNRMKLAESGRMVNGGMVEDVLVPPSVPAITGGMIDGGEGMQIMRPPDKSRTVKYKGSEYELYTPEEQIKRQTEKAQQSQYAEAFGKAQAGEDIRKKFGTQINLPGGQSIYAMPTEVDEVSRLIAAMTPKTPVQVPGRDVPYPPEVEQQRTRMNAPKEPAKIPGRDVPYPPEVEAQRKRLRGESGNGLTPGQEGVQNRFKERQLETDQKTLRDLEQKEAGLHAEKIRLGQVPMVDAEGKHNPIAQQARSGKLKALDKQIATIQGEKKKLIEKWGGTMEAPAEPPAQLTGERVRVKLADGRTGTVDAAEYDPKTMVQLPK